MTPPRNVLFRPYALPGPRLAAPTSPLWALLDWPCRELHDYALGLRTLWPIPCDLVVLEHDIVAPAEVVAELFACPEPTCVAMYRLYPASTGHEVERWAHRGTDGLFIDQWQEWVPVAALGLAKLSYRARSTSPPPPLVPWFDLDTSLSAHLETFWHVHKAEVEHLHR